MAIVFGIGSAQEPPDTFPVLQGLKTDGVESNLAWLIRDIAAGREERIFPMSMSPTKPDFQILFDGYITAYGYACSSFLPMDKVEWTLKRCEQSVRNSRGDFECVREGETHTQIFVDKNLLELKHALLRQLSLPVELTPDGPKQVQPSLGDMLGYVQNEQARKYYIDLWAAPVTLVADNGCLSPQLRRFQDNLVRHALRMPLLTAAIPPAAPPRFPPRTSPPFPDPYLHFARTNYLRLIQDMQERRDGAGYGILHDIPVESIKNIHAVRSDGHGNPSVIEADCKIEWSDGHPPPCYGIVIEMTGSGYPGCVGLKDEKPDPSRRWCQGSTFATDEIMAKYQAGGYNN